MRGEALDIMNMSGYGLPLAVVAKRVRPKNRFCEVISQGKACPVLGSWFHKNLFFPNTRESNNVWAKAGPISTPTIWRGFRRSRIPGDLGALGSRPGYIL